MIVKLNMAAVSDHAVSTSATPMAPKISKMLDQATRVRSANKVLKELAPTFKPGMLLTIPKVGRRTAAAGAGLDAMGIAINKGKIEKVDASNKVVNATRANGVTSISTDPEAIKAILAIPTAKGLEPMPYKRAKGAVLVVYQGAGFPTPMPIVMVIDVDSTFVPTVYVGQEKKALEAIQNIAASGLPIKSMEVDTSGETETKPAKAAKAPKAAAPAPAPAADKTKEIADLERQADAIEKRVGRLPETEEGMLMAEELMGEAQSLLDRAETLRAQGTPVRPGSKVRRKAGTAPAAKPAKAKAMRVSRGAPYPQEANPHIPGFDLSKATNAEKRQAWQLLKEYFLSADYSDSDLLRRGLRYVLSLGNQFAINKEDFKEILSVLPERKSPMGPWMTDLNNAVHDIKSIGKLWADMDAQELQDSVAPELLHEMEDKSGMPGLLTTLDALDEVSGYERGYVFWLLMYGAYDDAKDYAKDLANVSPELVSDEVLDNAEALGTLTAKDVKQIEKAVSKL